MFKGILHEDELEHIMLLQFGMMLLGGYKTQRQIDSSDISKADAILKRYSSELGELGIPCRFVSHLTSHLAEDVSNFKNPIEANCGLYFEIFSGFFFRLSAFRKFAN